MRAAHGASVLLIAMAFLAACSPGESPEDPRPQTTRNPASTTRITLPLDPYQITDEDYNTVSRALAVLTDRCMREKGFTYDEPAAPGVATAATGHERRYGITVLKTAKKYGYHLGGTPTQQARQPERSERYEHALTGTGRPTGDKGDFDDGCAGEAHRELEADIDMTAVDLPQWYKRDSFQRSLKDPRVTKEFAAWSGCMADAGHRFANPLDPPADRRVMGAKVTDYERSVAVADITCKQRTGLVDTWQAVESALQRATVDAQGTQLKKARTEATRLVARADRILGAGEN
ncbi:hypothetical protein [Streptomyces coerulescens]|uniref:Lipoprotein n=1 Tax=Streptomyces coerulescens TaxID=29304 RepID=A0ABW0CRF2_STRCD